MKKRSFIAGMLTTILLFGLVGSAYAAYQRQAALNYSGINILLDGELVIPKNANGEVVEPFAIDGTTYLPVRAVGNALGLDVTWDGEKNAVVLTSPKEEQSDIPTYDCYAAFSVPSLDNIVGSDALVDTFIPDTASGAMYFYDPAKFDLPDELNFAEEYFSLLESYGFHHQESSLNLVTYKNDHNGITVSTNWDDNSDRFIVIVVPAD